MTLIHFLIAYNRALGVVVSREQFTDAHEASKAYKDLELVHNGDPNMEIVLIGSDSIETVQRTHSNYFDDAMSFDDLLDDLLAAR